MSETPARERRSGPARSALDDVASRRTTAQDESAIPSASKEEERSLSAGPGVSGHNQGAPSHANRQAVHYCPYCAEETLFPLEKGWECRSCMRAFSVSFIGLVSREVRKS